MSFNYLSISAQQPAVWRRESRRDSRWCGECCGRVVIPNPYSKAKTRAQNVRKKLYVIRRLLTGLPLVQTSHDSAPGPDRPAVGGTARAGGAVLFLAASGAADTATANCVAQGLAQRTHNRDFDRRGLSVNIDDQIIQSVLRKRKGEVFAERRKCRCRV